MQAACHAQDPSTGEWAYEGWQDTIKHVTDLCASHGPFDGLWAFSQVRTPCTGFWNKAVLVVRRSAIRAQSDRSSTLVGPTGV